MFKDVRSENIHRKRENIEVQLDNLLGIFAKIDDMRTTNGLMPMDHFDSSSSSSDEDETKLSEEEKKARSKARKKQTIRPIPYDPEMFELNKDITDLRRQASTDIHSFVELCSSDAKMSMRLLKAISKFHKDRVEANERAGKIAAFHA